MQDVGVDVEASGALAHHRRGGIFIAFEAMTVVLTIGDGEFQADALAILFGSEVDRHFAHQFQSFQEIFGGNSDGTFALYRVELNLGAHGAVEVRSGEGQRFTRYREQEIVQNRHGVVGAQHTADGTEVFEQFIAGYNKFHSRVYF